MLYFCLIDLTKESKDVTSRWYVKCHQNVNIMSEAALFARGNKTELKQIAISIFKRKMDWEKQWSLWAAQIDMSSAPKI